MMIGALRLSLLLSLSLFFGCNSSPRSAMRYGQATGVEGDNIQGTSMLAGTFRDAGYRVTTARTLGRTVERANVVVWFPDRYRPPSKNSCEFFEQWLSGAPNRTLVYVGRDYDAQVAYWRRMNDETVASREVDAKAAYDNHRWRSRSRAASQVLASSLKKSQSCKWFQFDRDVRPSDADELTGSWAATASGAKYPPVVSTHLTPAGFPSKHIENLLQSKDHLLVTRLYRPHWRNNKIIHVANGSMFLNLPMVDRANQKLAGMLVQECGLPGRAVFLNSAFNDPAVANAPQSHYLLRVFTTAPLRCILMHLSVLGMVYCFAVFPIFGTPRSLERVRRTDFGRHVLALGRLLAGTGDVEHANASRKEYLQKVQGAQIADLAPSAGIETGNPFRTDAGT